ncbi:uncharacterized protein LOC122573539 isoform X3 [Bombus pyrosoma]|uniref:uncharacterized protein LOC122573539 isoform X3 n=1 Tax=Bombus pyrosoma TaxID=396416 RepID=UPI001CB98B71|nr:uncharacterized protein LOC122573539 isoform X3 [Bombus pyrosoma]
MRMDKLVHKKKGCSAKCGCRRIGLSCSPACTNCQGQSCSNVQSNPIDEDSCDIDEEIADSSSVEQFMGIQQEEEEEEEIEEDMTVEVEFKDTHGINGDFWHFISTGVPKVQHISLDSRLRGLQPITSVAPEGNQMSQLKGGK